LRPVAPSRFFSGGQLGLKINAPRVALDTITQDDLADDDVAVTAMQTYRARINGIIPKYRSEPHRWEYMPSALVSVPSYVTQDGEEKNEERQWNLVQEPNQAAQLAAYDLVNARELGPIEIVCKPRMRGYAPGDLLIVDLPDAGLSDQPCVILRKSLDPVTMKVSLTLITETEEKHDFALGRTGTPPPTPTITGTEEIDDAASLIRDQDPRPYVRIQPSLSSFRYDGAGTPIPDDQVITFEAEKQNTAEAVYWSVYDGEGNAKAPASDYLSDNEGDVVSMTEAQFAAARGSTNGVRVQAQVVDGSFTARDNYPISYVQDGAAGITASLTTPSFPLSAYSDGTPIAGQFDFTTGTFRVFSGGTEVTTGHGVVFSKISQTSCVGTIDASTGVYAITALDAGVDTVGVLSLRAVYAGATFDLDFVVTKNSATPLPASTDIVQSVDEFTVDYTGAEDPTGQIVIFTALNKTAGQTVYWKVYDVDGVEQTPTTDYLSAASGDTVSMDFAQFEAARNGHNRVDILMTLGAGAQYKGFSIMRRVGPPPPMSAQYGATPQQIRTNSSGALDPSGQSITFNMDLVNATGTIAWSVKDLAGNNRTPTTTYLSAASGSPVTMSGAQFLAAANGTGGVDVIATVSGTGTFLDGAHPIRVLETGDGASAIDLRVIGDRTNIMRDAFGRIWPASQTTTITADRVNFTGGTTNWTIQDGNGNYLTPVTDWLSAATGDSVTIAADKVVAAAGASRQVTIWAGNGTLSRPVVDPDGWHARTVGQSLAGSATQHRFDLLAGRASGALVPANRRCHGGLPVQELHLALHQRRDVGGLSQGR
jgi:hypothetical protein